MFRFCSSRRYPLPFPKCGGAVASLLVHSTPDQAVQVQALARDIVLSSNSYGASLHPGLQIGSSKCNAGGDLR